MLKQVQHEIHLCYIATIGDGFSFLPLPFFSFFLFPLAKLHKAKSPILVIDGRVRMLFIWAMKSFNAIKEFMLYHLGLSEQSTAGFPVRNMLRTSLPSFAEGDMKNIDALMYSAEQAIRLVDELPDQAMDSAKSWYVMLYQTADSIKSGNVLLRQTADNTQSWYALLYQITGRTKSWNALLYQTTDGTKSRHLLLEQTTDGTKLLHASPYPTDNAIKKYFSKNSASN